MSGELIVYRSKGSQIEAELRVGGEVARLRLEMVA